MGTTHLILFIVVIVVLVCILVSLIYLGITSSPQRNMKIYRTLISDLENKIENQRKEIRELQEKVERLESQKSPTEKDSANLKKILRFIESAYKGTPLPAFSSEGEELTPAFIDFVIESGDLEKAIRELIKIVEGEDVQTVKVIQSSLSRLKMGESRGTIDEETAERERRKITQSLLSVLSNMSSGN